VPFPAGVPTVTVTKDYRDGQGSPPKRVLVSFTPSQRRVVTAQGLTIEPIAVSKTLTDGLLSVVLATTIGFSYRVSELVDGKQRAPFDILLPEGSGPLKLDELAPVEPVIAAYTPVRTVEGIGPDALGNIDLPPAQGSDPAGTAAAGDAAHLVAADPHPQYLTPTEGNLAYAALAHNHPQSDVIGLPAALTGKASKKIIMARTVTSGNIPLSTGTNVWGPLAGSPTLTVPAIVGDLIKLEVGAALRQLGANQYTDLAVVVAGQLRRLLGNGQTGTPPVPISTYEGNSSLYHTNLPASGGVYSFVATANDLDSGNVVVSFAVRSTGAGTPSLLASPDDPLVWALVNEGPVVSL
jgi:hypothetical protein